jgi:hypothetical protein
MEPPFNAGGLRTIDHTELILSKTIQPGVDVVQVRGDTTVYIHKYMTPNCFPASFNIEVNNYTKLGDSPYVPDLVAVITKNNENRGLLLSAIDGDDLSELRLTLNDKWSVTAKLLHVLVDLESRSYFPQDLKPGNIMLRSVDKSLVIIDLGDGLTEGYYRDRSGSKRIEDRRMAPAGEFRPSDSFYTIGRTIWAIWSDDDFCFKDAEPPTTIPALIRDLIHNCCDVAHFKDIRELYDEYYESIKCECDSINSGFL